MAETKYDKYIIEYDPSRYPNERRPVMARMESSVMEGSHFYLIHWMMPNVAASFADRPMGGHPPHIHRDVELLFHIGTNPDDPMDLGSEVEIYLGPELERHVFNRTCCIYIPPNFIHGPWRPLNTTRPWIFIEVNQGGEHTEKSYRQLLPKEVRENTNWAMWPDEGYDGPD
ncbi:MAG TPA: hypothetical protein G4O16_04805 [Dehalococcoidia bacterium]|nr:hypothetical protein [Dehalococcoidia bacterium]